MECPVCEEEMDEGNVEFMDDAFADSAFCVVTMNCCNELCPLGDKDLEVHYSYSDMMTVDGEDIDEGALKQEYKERKVLEKI